MASPWVENWLPPAVRHAGNTLLGRTISYRGPYPDHEAAKAQVRGYDEGGILAAVEAATLSVMRKEARYEQDSRTFAGEPPADHALCGLLLAAAASGGRLSVLDFGGSLGSHYLRWRPVLAQLESLRWCVVEQEHFVIAGRRVHEADPRISFEATIAAAAPGTPNAVLASGVLQFLPDPYQSLAELAALRAEVIVIARTPFSTDDRDHVVSQHVGMPGNRSSYALQSLSASRFDKVLAPLYEKVMDYDSSDQAIRTASMTAPYRGAIWQLKR